MQDQGDQTDPNSRHPAVTWELTIRCLDADERERARLKEEVKTFLLASGVSSFVEGALDDVDIDNEYGEPNRDFYGELGGDSTPIVVYKYSRHAIDELAASIRLRFPQNVAVAIAGTDTATWLEGWKQSFLPIETESFFVFPPWFTGVTPHGKLPLVIEPGMAFGTGQHATTILCLRVLESMAKRGEAVGRRLADVGTGTGILAFAGAALGFAPVVGTDIDPDALLAAAANEKLNEALLAGRAPRFAAGSAPRAGETFDVVVANILAHVLLRLMPDLAKAVTPGGKLILSGLLVEDESRMARAGQKCGLKLVGNENQDGWAALTFERLREPAGS